MVSRQRRSSLSNALVHGTCHWDALLFGSLLYVCDKNAMLIKEKNPDTRVTILYMDIRAYGKGYEEYYARAEQLGVRFIRGCQEISMLRTERSSCRLKIQRQRMFLRYMLISLFCLLESDRQEMHQHLPNVLVSPAMNQDF